MKERLFQNLPMKGREGMKGMEYKYSISMNAKGMKLIRKLDAAGKKLG